MDFISATAIITGLAIKFDHDTNRYLLDVKITLAELAFVSPRSPEIQDKWNYLASAQSDPAKALSAVSAISSRPPIPSAR